MTDDQDDETVIVIDTGDATDMGLADENADWILTKEQRKGEMKIIKDSQKRHAAKAKEADAAR